MNELTFEQMGRLLELRKEYGYDVAVAKRDGHSFRSLQEELDVLALLQLSRQIRDAVENFAQVVPIENLSQFVMLGTICNEAIGKIAKNLDQIHPKEQVDSALQAIDKNRNRFREE